MGLRRIHPDLALSPEFLPYSHSSVPFSIFRGTRQGCPRPTALFILAIEPLAIALRTDPNIIGIPYAGESYKISLIADDALLTLINPITTLPNLQNLLSRFAAISGLQINPHKSTAMIVTFSEQTVSNIQASG